MQFFSARNRNKFSGTNMELREELTFYKVRDYDRTKNKIGSYLLDKIKLHM